MAIAKVILNGEVLMDVTDTTATAPDVLQKYFYGADGVKTLGTGTGGADGDELGYGNTANLVGYGLIDSLVIDSYGYGYAGYFTTYDHIFGVVDVLEVEEEEGENDGV